jgi:hypothetical protein
MKKEKKFKIVETNYDDNFLDSVIECLGYDLKDLETWSVYNDDKLNSIVCSLNDSFMQLIKWEKERK